MAMHGLVLLRTRKDASILTSGLASLYCLYLQWSALSSDTSGECNKNLTKKGMSWMQVVFGMMFTMVSLFIISSSSKKTKGSAANTGGHLMEEAEDLDKRPKKNNQ